MGEAETAKNRYKGVNPHLNSRLQSKGGRWRAFHTAVIDCLMRDLDARLPPDYFALSEDSLQLSIESAQGEMATGQITRITPDVTVYQRGTPSTGSGTLSPAATPTLTLPVVEAPDDEDYLAAVLIYRFDPTADELPEKPVTRIEVLSPANKPGGSRHLKYLTRRREGLQSGLCLVEIDWLHETPPVVRGIPSYADHEAGAYPYWIIVSDPRPTLAAGQTQVYGSGVDEPLPVINIPLEGTDVIPVDFEGIYQQTFEGNRAWRLFVDYHKEPVRFHTYSAADQQRIRQRMTAIAAEQP